MLVCSDVSHNQLNGSIPAELGGCASAIEMNLSHNQLTGSVPAALGSLTNVKLRWVFPSEV